MSRIQLVSTVKFSVEQVDNLVLKERVFVILDGNFFEFSPKDLNLAISTSNDEAIVEFSLKINEILNKKEHKNTKTKQSVNFV